MSKKVVRVGVREFREGLAHYMDSSTAVAVTRHGRTVGYYIPAPTPLSEEERDSLLRAVGTMEDLLKEHGIDIDEVISDFDAVRHKR